jgi:hypothetical protein
VYMPLSCHIAIPRPSHRQTATSLAAPLFVVIVFISWVIDAHWTELPTCQFNAIQDAINCILRLPDPASNSRLVNGTMQRANLNARTSANPVGNVDVFRDVPICSCQTCKISHVANKVFAIFPVPVRHYSSSKHIQFN